jgi:hypothetical protein
MQREFRIKWEGYDTRYNTWEPEGNLQDNVVFYAYLKR